MSNLLLLLVACGPSTLSLGSDSAATDDTGVSSDDTQDSLPEGEFTIELSINEVMADNELSFYTDDGASPDWVELVNTADYDLDLLGFTMSDDFEEPDVHRFTESLIVPAGGFLLLYSDGEPDLGPEHLSFRLAADGEEVGIYTEDGRALDLVRFGAQVADMALARVQDGDEEAGWEYVFEGTPGESNE